MRYLDSDSLDAAEGDTVPQLLCSLSSLPVTNEVATQLLRSFWLQRWADRGESYRESTVHCLKDAF